MPRANPEEYRAYMREYMRKRYQSDKKFRESEAERKAEFYRENREQILERQKEPGPRERHNAAARSYYERNREAILEKQRERRRKEREAREAKARKGK